MSQKDKHDKVVFTSNVYQTLKAKGSVTIEDIFKEVAAKGEERSFFVMLDVIRKVWKQFVHYDNRSINVFKLKRNQEAGKLVCTINDYLP
jgi:hypothetical protein